jgi:redox-sensing transcriptional repressor
VNKISIAVIRRLPKYHRYLKELLDKDIQKISSKELSDIIGFTASQIRQDLNNFGGFGQQGYGYNVRDLFNEIGAILGMTREYNSVIVGAGNLGQALANFNFAPYGFNIKAMFDKNPRLLGLRIRDLEVMDVTDMISFIKENGIEIGFICTNKESAQEVADKLVEGGIKAIWNFAPTDIKVDDEIIVENVHLIDSLLTLSYFIK